VRIATLYDDSLPNSRYRCIIPMRALAERGHDIVWPGAAQTIQTLCGCDLVHIHRLHGPATDRLVVELRRAGVVISYDNDDDLAAVHRDSPTYRTLGGLRGQRSFLATARVARKAALVTTPSDVLAERYRRSGVKHVEVIENYLPAEFMAQERRKHRGVVVGWIAGLEHAVDASRLGLDGVLLALLDRHPQMRVALIGADLQLRHERYFHLERTDFASLLHSAAGFDIGLAPLADTPFNAARSNVKLKEYAALGIPWLASPVGPYTELGVEQGGLLVTDDAWEHAIEGLVTSPRRRARLARRARAWARGQTIEAAAGQWESAFEAAIDRNAAGATKGASRTLLSGQ
jgi:glycosyltransferase involved in cell wall biosynthesis